MPINTINYATKFIHKKVHVIIDRPLNSKHPKYNLIYPINYGYVPNTKAPDSKEIDAYILGISKPLKEFTGQCIAVIHRSDDNDDKLIVAPENKSFTDREIKDATYFQEKYFESKIIRK